MERLDYCSHDHGKFVDRLPWLVLTLAGSIYKLNYKKFQFKMFRLNVYVVQGSRNPGSDC
jgi:hypothetical protein